MKSLYFCVRNCWGAMTIGLLACLTLPTVILAQTTYHYPLNNSFNEATGSASALIPRPNALAQTGTFATLPLPPTTCGGEGVFSGYAYDVDAGFSFSIPAGFITCEYTIQFTWRYDNPVIPGSVPPLAMHEWIRIFSMVHTDDSGIYLWTIAPSLNGTLYYWYLQPLFPGFPFCPPVNGALSSVHLLNPNDFYQMTFTRSCDDIFHAYVNGVLVGSLNDSDQRYVASGANPQITFFRDTANTTCYAGFPEEASSGFVSDLRISNAAWTAGAVAASYAGWCPTLLPLNWQVAEGLAQPAGNLLRWQVAGQERIDGFVIERRNAAQAFVQIGEATATGGPGDRLFSYLDWQPEGSEQYYRIGARDLDGRMQYSPVIEVRAEQALRIYPNPALDYLIVEIPVGAQTHALEILDVRGIRLQHHRLAGGQHRLSLEGLPEGLLLVRIGGQVWRIVKGS